MASVVEEIRVLRMSGGANNRLRADSRRRVFLEVAYKLYARQVYAVAMRLLASMPEAEEVTAQVFVDFGRELPRVWDESRVQARLRELAITEALRRLWARKRKRLGGQAAIVGASPATFTEALADGNVGVRAAAPALDSAMLKELTARLPDDLRAAFVLHDLEGLNIRDTAKCLRAGEREVRTLISRARLELRRLWRSQSNEKGDR